MKNNYFWEKKKVLITGISGFVGSNLAKNLSNIGANVVGLTQKKRKKHSLLFYEKIHKKVNVIFGDITDRKLIKKIIKKYKIEICFHLAAQVEEELDGGATLAEIAREIGVEPKSTVPLTAAYSNPPASSWVTWKCPTREFCSQATPKASLAFW